MDVHDTVFCIHSLQGIGWLSGVFLTINPIEGFVDAPFHLIPIGAASFFQEALKPPFSAFSLGVPGLAGTIEYGTVTDPV